MASSHDFFMLEDASWTAEKLAYPFSSLHSTLFHTDLKKSSPVAGVATENSYNETHIFYATHISWEQWQRLPALTNILNILILSIGTAFFQS